MDNPTLIALIGLGLLVFAITLGGFWFYWNIVVTGVKDYYQIVREIKSNVKALFANEAGHSFAYRFAMPLLFFSLAPVCFIAMYFFVKYMGSIPHDTWYFEFCGLLLGVFALAVLGFWGRSEKHIGRKFWIELIVAVILELGLAAEASWFLNGFTVEDSRDIKLFIGFLFIGIPFFAEYMRHTQHNWRALLNEKQAQEATQL